MIAGTGYGLFVVIGVYMGCFFAASKIMPSDTSNLAQTILITITCILSTGINYLIAKVLNKKEVSHTVFGIKLETVVLFSGAFLLFMAMMMLGGALKDLNG